MSRQDAAFFIALGSWLLMVFVVSTVVDALR